MPLYIIHVDVIEHISPRLLLLSYIENKDNNFKCVKDREGFCRINVSCMGNTFYRGSQNH